MSGIKIRVHILSASIELFLAILFSLSMSLSIFRAALLNNPEFQINIIDCSLFISMFMLIFWFLAIYETRNFNWYLQKGLLVKQDKHTDRKIETVEFKHILNIKVRREVPLVGRNWNLTLTMKEVLPKPKVLVNIGKMTITGSPGMHRIYRICCLRHEDIDLLLEAFAMVKEEGNI